MKHDEQQQRRFVALVPCLLVALVSAGRSTAQGTNDAVVTPERVETDILAADQSNVADKFGRLEKLMFRMAEYDAGQNPRRAALLQKAIGLSKEKNIRPRLETLVRLLNQDKLNRALDDQKEVRADLQALLELLSSEDRADHIKDQRKRYLSYIKEIERILRQQRDVQGRTEGGVDAKRLSDAQARIAERTAKLDAQIGENESPNDQSEGADDRDQGANGKDGESEDGDSEDGDSKDGESKDGESEDGESRDGESKDGESEDGKSKDGKSEDGKSKDGKSKDGKSKDGESKDGESKDGESKDGESKDGDNKDGESQGDSSSPSDSQQGDSQQGQSQQEQQSQSQQDSQQDVPARKRLQEAERKMREAQQRLEEARRDEATEAQEKARRELEAAKAELEEILRQLREEEIERTLTLLESRFRRMLEMQIKVYESTLRLDKIPLARRDRHVDLEATKLSFQERRIVIEADKTLALLQEEGSSVAFPESVVQMRDDMEQVGERLAQAKIGRRTQGLEEDIIEALDEMVEAMQQAQLDQQQQQQQQLPPPGSGDQEQPLVDKIAELKMLKALQLRINKRTQRYSNFLDDIEDPAGQAADDDLIAALRRLADREARLQEITRDLVLGKNR